MPHTTWRLRVALALAVVILCVPAAAGCESSYTKKFQKSDHNYGSREGYEQHRLDGPLAYGLTIPGGGNHNNKKLRYNKKGWEGGQA